MNWVLPILVGTQLLFTASDLLARHYMPKFGLTTAAFISPWFLAYVALRIPATIGQLYIFTTVELGKTMSLFGATSIILANVLGLLVLREALPVQAYIGASIAVIAFLVLAFS